MNKKVKWILISTGIFFTLMILLVTGTLLYLKSNHFQQIAQNKINQAIPGTILWETFRFSLTQGRFEIRNALLRGPGDEELAGFDRLFLDVSWMPLFQGDVTIEDVTLEKPRVFLQTDSDGGLNLLKAFPPSSPEKEKKEKGELPVNIVVRKLCLAGGMVRYEKPDEPMAAELEDINLTGAGNFQKREGHLALHIDRGKIDRLGITTHLDQLDIETRLKDGNIEPLTCQLSSTPLNLSLSGNIREVFKAPLAALNLDLDASLSDIQQGLGLKPEFTGNANARITAQGMASNPDIDLRLDYGGGNLAGNHIDQINLNCQLKDRLLMLNPLNIHAGSGSLNLSGEVNLKQAFADGFLAPQKNLEAISYQLALREDNIALDQLLTNQKAVKGTLNSDISINGSGISPKTLSADITLDVSADQLAITQVESPVDVSIKAAANLDNGMVRVSQLNADAGDITLAANGDYHFVSQEIAANLALNAPNLAKTLSSLGMKDITGTLELDADVSGSVMQPVFKLLAAGDNLRFKDITIGDVDIDASSDASGMVRIARLNLENQGSEVSGNGTLRLFSSDPGMKINSDLPMNVDLSLRNVETKDFLKKEIINGSVSGKLRADGTLNNLKAELSLQGKDIAAEGSRIGDISMDARLAQGKVYLDRADIQNQNSSLQVSGTAQVFEKNTLTPLKTPLFDVQLNTESLLIQDFTEKFKGKLALKAHISGTHKEPKGTVELQGTDMDTGVQKIKSLSLISELDGKTINVHPIEVTFTSGESVTGTGWLSLEKAFDVVLRSEGVSLEQIDAIQKQKIARGKLRLDVSAKGTFDNPELTGTIGLNQVRVSGKSIEDLTADIHLKDQMAQVRLSPDSTSDKKGSLWVDAQYHLKDKDFSALAQFDGTDLSPYFKLANQQELSGALTGKIEAKGNAGVVESIDVSANVDRLRLLFKGNEMISTENFSASFKNEEFLIHAGHFRLLKHGTLDLSGKGNIKGPLDVNVKGDIPLRVATMFSQDVPPDLTGNLILSGNVRGNPSQPDINAQVSLKNAGLTVPGIMQKLHGVNGKILLTPTQLSIKELKGQLDTGSIELGGNVRLSKFQPVKADIRLNVHTLPVKYPDMLDMLLNADLRMTGTPEKTALTGEAVILEGEYYKDVNLTMGIIKGIGKKKRETAPVSSSEISQPFLKNMNLDITLKHRDSFLINNDLAELEVNPDLRIYGTLNKPLVSGRAEIGSGTITYQKKTFDVQKGVIDFLNPYKIEPTLDIESEVIVRDWTIYLTVSGTPDKLNFKLTSDPAEEHADILSLLVMGKTTEELGESSGASQAPAQMVAELIAKTVGEDIKNAAGLDILEVEVNGEDDDEDEEASDKVKVTFGKELSKRMTVKYSVESKNGEMTQQAITEYKFLENFLLTGFQDNKGTFGGEIQFRLEFR